MDPAATLLVVLYALWWALWRRCLGGYGGFPRSLLFGIGAVMAALPFTDSWWGLAAAASVAFWAPGHRVDTWTVWLRYPGPMALGYVVVGKINPPRLNSFLDGWMAYGELWAGFCFGLILALVRGVL